MFKPPFYRSGLGGVSRLLGALPLLLLSSGCLAQSAVDSPSQLAAQRARVHAAEQRAVALERRLAEVERLAQANAAARPASAASAPDKLDRLIAAQEQLLARLAEAQAAATARPVAESKKPDGREPICRQRSSELAGFEARLQDLYERAQTDLPPWRGGLSREKREALRILLREDRELDRGNPLEL